MKTLFLLPLLLLTFSLGEKEEKVLVRNLEKNLVEFKNGKYLAQQEVTNRMYRQFLEAREAEGRDISAWQIQPEGWKQLSPTWHWLAEGYHTEKAWADYPVVNVPHEGARAFCAWLTEVYNQSSHRKEFEKVEVRLPSREEWLAAATPENQAVFPWGDLFLTEPEGSVRANYRRTPEFLLANRPGDKSLAIKDHGGAAPMRSAPRRPPLNPVEMFVQTESGLANLCGNAAEMLLQPAQTIGGSWNSAPYYLRLDAEDEYAGVSIPNPMTGFRYMVIHQ